MVPAMSKMPTRASRPAAVVSAMPWSWADGMKWVPISPLVVAPQMAKPPARAQKVVVRAASRRARDGAAGGPGRVRCGAGPGSSAGAP